MVTADFASYRRDPSTAPKDLSAPASRRPKIQPRRISDWVYEELCEAIRTGDLAPGAPLSEPSLAAYLNVSRAPIRDALTRLADQRLVAVVPQVGTRVAPILMDEVEEACFIRSALERGAFQKAIAAPERDRRPLLDILERNVAASEARDTEAFFSTDEQLHQEVFALAGVPHVWEVIRGIKLHLDRLRHLYLPDSIGDARVIDEHRAIVEALIAGDEAKGLEVIERHSTRIITDTDLLRVRYPDYFEK